MIDGLITAMDGDSTRTTTRAPWMWGCCLDAYAWRQQGGHDKSERDGRVRRARTSCISCISGISDISTTVSTSELQ
ncbi:expressed unknown protein [Ectocarpus siliculosus]|uniref:Uncharacterized protein n=1 Tax=Ectocarpus siliculosus TaxID=2880 RepID=D7G678_ECTSI|nr:expressed unknown protein [Ectocarpus siliculosus]|eukprot:CBJ27473.1 expressed unknown protein [Ectocarpus siliculosus]